MANQIQIRRDTASNWTSADTVLAQGEWAYETDTGKKKLGDGSTAWTSLPYEGEVTDGDTLATGLTFPNAGLHILDTNASHDLIVTPGSDLTADRTLTITTGDADRTLTISGSTTISGTNTGDQTISLSGDVTGSGTGSITTTIASGAVDLAMLSATGTPSGSTYLRGDNTWAAVSGTGDVVGPASAVDSNFAAFDSTTGKLIKDSGSAASSFEAAGAISTHAAVTSGVHGISAFGATLVDDADAATARSTLGLAIGSDVQAYDADLTALAGLTSAADKGIQFTGSGTAATFDLTAAGKALLDDADASAQRTTLGLVIGTDVQAYDADLAAIAGLTSAADKGIQFTGIGTAATFDLTAAGKALLDDATAADQRTTLGLVIGTDVQAFDTELSALAGLTSAADKGIQFTGAGTAGTFDLTAAGKALLDDADAAAQRTTLGLVIGTDVQAYDAELAALAGLTSAADTGIQFTGAGTAGTFTLTAAGKALLDDADASAQRTTLGLGTAAVLNTGTSDGNVVIVATGGKLPALDGSDLTNLPSGGSPDASTVTYTPATVGNWNGAADPGNADDALDQLAARVKYPQIFDQESAPLAGDGIDGAVPAPAAAVTLSVLDQNGSWVQDNGIGTTYSPTNYSLGGSSIDAQFAGIDTALGAISGIADGATLSTGLTFPNTGLHILDTNASHDLIIAAGSDLTADRQLTITTGDAARTLTLSGNATLSGGTHSGTNTGDQTITLTGDVTGSGTGSFAASISSSVITTAARTVLDDTTVSAMVDTLGGASATGTGGIARATSPTFVTPILGTPTSGTLTNCDGTASSLTAGQATAALGIKTATTTVAVDSATAPSSGQVLTATGSTAATWQTPTGATGATGAKEAINQTAHGFSVGNAVKFASSVWAKAQADSAANAEVLGIVETVTDVDNFTVVYGGRIAGLSGLTANTTYYLDASTAGALTSTEPTGTNVSKPVLYATSTTSGVVLIQRGLIEGTEDAQLASLADLSFSGNASKIIAVNSGETGFELVGRGMVLLASGTASSSSALTFDGCFSSTYDAYQIQFVDLAVATDNVAILFRWRDAGADVTGATHYTGFRYQAPVISVGGDIFANSTSGHLCPYTELGNAAGECCKLSILAFPRSTTRKEIFFAGSYVNYIGNLIQVQGGSTLANTTAMSGFKVLASSGNIASGSIYVYGIPKA